MSTATLCTTARAGKDLNAPPAEGWTEKMQYLHTGVLATKANEIVSSAATQTPARDDHTK